jgi:hypothetical protein
VFDEKVIFSILFEINVQVLILFIVAALSACRKHLVVDKIEPRFIH